MKSNRTVLTLAILTLALPIFAASPQSEPDIKRSAAERKAGLEISYAQAPLSFEAIQGKGEAKAEFVSRGNGFSIGLAPTEATLVLRTQESPNGSLPSPRTLRMKLVGASASTKVTPMDPLPGQVNYFIGNDPKQWRTKVPTFAKVKCEEAYPGVDLVYYGNGRQLEFDFIIAPGGDPRQIKLAFEGADRVEIAANGDLVLHLGDQELRQRNPLIYQKVNGVRKEIAGGFKLNDKREARFELAAYDKRSLLVIDPVLTYSTYLGGNSTDLAADVAVDTAGNFYVVGSTMSTDFPVLNALQPTNALHSIPGVPGIDVFVTKFRPDGSVIYSTYLGGPDFYYDEGDAIAVDASGNAYITGFAGSRQFPTTPGAFQTAAAGGQGDAFVAKLSSDGSSLLYSTYLGGSQRDPRDSSCCFGTEQGNSIAIDSAGAAYVCGVTTSADFPVTANAVQRTYGGGGYRANNGGGPAGDAFIAKLSPDGSALEFATYLGGEGDETANGIAVDAQGNVFVTGTTGSANFPATANAFQKQFAHPVSDNDAANNVNVDAYVAKLSASGSVLLYATYLGGSGPEQDFYSGGRQLAIDSNGAAYVVGVTRSPDFPAVNAMQSVLRNTSGFLTKVTPDGSGLVFSTFFGCQAFVRRAAGIALDQNGDIFVSGAIDSSFGFPLVNALQPPEDNAAFLTKISGDASRLLYSTTLGGGAGLGVAVDTRANAYVVGFTPSSTFPITANAFQLSNHGDWDAFVTIVHSESEPAAPTPAIVCPANIVVNAAAGQCSAVVNYSVSASSPNSRCVEVTSIPPSGSVFPIGSTTVICQAKDAVGASATCSFTVTVNDTQRPVITCPANITVNAPCGQSSAVVNFPTPLASDLCSDVSVTCTPPSGSEFPVGITRVNCVARDAAGNAAVCRFTVTVNTLPFDFTGFLPPIGGADATGGSFASPLRTFKMNSTIPVKFTASCGGALVVTDVHTLQAIKYSDATTGGTPIDATPTDGATDGNQFRLTGTEWHFNLDTKATSMSPGIWQLRATLSDGSQHSVWIQIK